MLSGVATHLHEYPGWDEVVEGLWRHDAADDPCIDVVFIHGLGAHWFNTWRCHSCAESWMDWIATQDPSACVHAIDYAVGKSDWNAESMQLIERAKNLLDRLALGLAADRPLIFICHSMGGLHVKKMLEIAQRPGAPEGWLALAQRTEGVIFFSTPHQGSPLATWVMRLPRWLLRPTIAIDDLRAHSSRLADLGEVFRTFVHAHDVRVHSYYERSRTRLGDRLGRFLSVTVVDRNSSNPHIVGAQHICLDGDHSSICQFSSQTAQGYLGVLQFLERWTALPPADPAPPIAPSAVKHPTIGGMPPGPSNLPDLPATIVGRPQVTSDIHDALIAGRGPGVLRQVAATAHGGYGKTIAALLYADEYADFYPGGRFFLSMEKADLAVQLASLARPLQLPAPDDPPAAAALVKHALESGGRAEGSEAPSLLILDNIIDVAHWTGVADSGLLPGGSCRVLITTRADTVLPDNAVRIGALSLPQAREVYGRFCGDARDYPTEKTADAITRLLGGLAVAVAAVSASARLQPERSWDDIYRALVSTRVDELPDADPVVRDQIGLDGMTLADHRRTLRVIDDALDALPPSERRAVQYAALLPEDMVPANWLEALLDADIARASGNDDPLAIIVSADADESSPPAKRVLAHLEALDVLVPKGEDDRLLSLHRLWRARVNERAELEGVAEADRGALWSAIAGVLWSRRAVLVGEDINHPAVLTEQELRGEFSPLAATVASLWAAGRPGEAARVGVWLGPLLLQLGRVSEAAACLRPIRDHQTEVERAIGYQSLAACYSNLAAIQSDLGELSAAKDNMEHAIAIDQKHFDPDHPTLAIRHCNLAMILKDLGEPAAAKENMEHAIAIDQKHFDPDHSTFATSYSNLALILQDLGDLPAAKENMEHAIAIDQKHFDPDHPTLAVRYSNLALILKDLGDLPAAKENMEHAIAIDQKHFDPDHPNFAVRWHNLAAIVFDEGDAAGAAALEEKALGILLRHFSEEHPHLKNSRIHLAHYRAALE